MKKILGLFSISDCGGCLLQLRQDLELIDVLSKSFEIVDFDPKIQKDHKISIVLVEGRIRSDKDIDKIKAVRRHCDKLILLGACANKDNFGKIGKPITKYIRYDHAIPGCPVNLSELTDCLMSLFWEKSIHYGDFSVCAECKRNFNDCLIKDHHQLCLGPVTQGGCDSICINFGESCSGCRGKLKDANLLKLEEISANLEQKELISYIDGKVK